MNQDRLTQSYLTDLGLAPARPSRRLLEEIQRRHLAKYSFNSLAVVQGKDIGIDSQSVFEKIVRQGRGGYCFEHNKLTFDALQALGFEVRLLLARVVYNRDIDVPRTHRLSLVLLDGERYLVDTGFGHLGPLLPVRLTPGLIQEQGDGRYRIMADDRGHYQLQIVKDGAFFSLYRFDLGHYSEADCLPSHFYSHKYPGAGFVNNLVASLRRENDTWSLKNGELRHLTGTAVQTFTLDSAKQLRERLADCFALAVSPAEAKDLFARFILPGLGEQAG
ncbi:arylamine N-acetyltransferase [Gallaecimonas sp. GXIMD4217]|uniref:arylamine N-acetyltransferase family protein n=1 Tax=Gallaecimonas sp. GXIMD4217 TaxID=3131927 RepID=UPI00311AE607